MRNHSLHKIIGMTHIIEVKKITISNNLNLFQHKTSAMFLPIIIKLVFNFSVPFHVHIDSFAMLCR